MSLEYTVLARRNPDYRVEQWSPVDSLAWLKAMAWDLRATTTTSSPARACRGRPPQRSARSTRPTPSTATSRSLGEGAGGDARQSAAAHQAAARSRRPPPLIRRPSDGAAIASRPLHAARRIPGSRPRRRHRLELVGRLRLAHTTGKPLLANDPHLGAVDAGHLDTRWPAVPHRSPACPFDVAGFTFPACPGVVIGHNAARSPGASPTSAPTSPTSTSSRSSATRTCATGSGSRSPAPGGHQGRRRRRRAAHRAQHRARPDAVRRRRRRSTTAGDRSVVRRAPPRPNRMPCRSPGRR